MRHNECLFIPLLGLHSYAIFLKVHGVLSFAPSGTQHFSTHVDTVPQSQISPSSWAPFPQIAQKRSVKQPPLTSRPLASTKRNQYFIKPCKSEQLG